MKHEFYIGLIPIHLFSFLINFKDKIIIETNFIIMNNNKINKSLT